MRLALDSSTRVTGWCSMVGDAITNTGVLRTDKLVGVKAKTDAIVDFVRGFDLLDVVILEAPAHGFANSSSKVLLLQFNAVLAYRIEFELHKRLLLQNVSHARKVVFGKAREIGTKPKDFVRRELSKLIDVSKFEIRTKRGAIDKVTEDIFDAIVLAKSYSL